MDIIKELNKADDTYTFIANMSIKDLEDVPQEIKDKLKIHGVKHVEEIIKEAFVN